LKKKLSDKDKKDWQNFLSSKEKVSDKDLSIKENIRKDVTKRIDLHGFSLEDANIVIDDFITKSFHEEVTRVIVITGKGLRSKNISNPYISKDLSILRHSVPEFIKSKKNLMKMIKEIKEAEIEDGGSGAFYIYLNKNK
jgi:DNA-nicking Smr family endonuclease